MEQVTLQSVAKKAGVSISTVHRVIKNKHDVSPRTSEVVRKVARQLGYPLGYESQQKASSPKYASLHADE